MDVYVQHVCLVPTEVSKGVSDILELELQTVLSWEPNPGPL